MRMCWQTPRRIISEFLLLLKPTGSIHACQERSCGNDHSVRLVAETVVFAAVRPKSLPRNGSGESRGERTHRPGFDIAAQPVK